MESDFEDDLADVMEDSDIDFMVQDEHKDDDKDEDQEADISIWDTNQILHTTVHDSAKDGDTDIQDKKINQSSNVMIPRHKFIRLCLQGIEMPKKNALNSMVRLSILSKSLRCW